MRQEYNNPALIAIFVDTSLGVDRLRFELPLLSALSSHLRDSHSIGVVPVLGHHSNRAS